jgi:peptide/nickel transport system substrate-binding protein
MKMQRRRAGVIVLLLLLLTAGTFLYQGTHPDAAGLSRAQEKHVLRIGILREIESLNPMVVWSMHAYEVMHLNYSLLISWDEDLNPVPNLARSWTRNEDGSVWTFELEQGVLWHDGKPLTSEDVKFTFEYMRDNELGYFTDYVEPIVDVETPDATTVVVTFEEPQSWMPHMWVPIIPKHVWEEVDPEEAGSTYENLESVGSGPFQTVEHRKGQYLRMAANPKYFKGAPKIDEIIFVTFANAPTMAEALKLGEVDIIVEVPGAQFKSLIGTPGIVTLEGASPSFTELAFNVWDDPDSGGNPLLLDRQIRIAIEHAIDRQRIIDGVSFGYGEPATTLVPAIYDFWHLKLPASEIREFNPAKARQILDEAGYKDDGSGIRKSPEGKPLSFSLIARSEAPESVPRCQLIKEWLKDIGIEVTLEVLDDGALTDRIYDNADFDMFNWGWYVDVDPTSILRIMTTDQIFWWNDCFYSNPDYDELFYLQQTQMDLKERQATIREMQRILYEDAPYIMLVYDPELQAYRTDKFEGWVRTPDDGPVILTHSIKTYENLRPIEKTTPVDPGNGDPKASGSLLPWLLLALAATALGFFLARRRKQQDA